MARLARRAGFLRQRQLNEIRGNPAAVDGQENVFLELRHLDFLENSGHVNRSFPFIRGTEQVGCRVGGTWLFRVLAPERCGKRRGRCGTVHKRHRPGPEGISRRTAKRRAVSACQRRGTAASSARTPCSAWVTAAMRS